MIESHMPCQGYITTLFVSGIKNNFKARGNFFDAIEDVVG
jgi:hypothetical protein